MTPHINSKKEDIAKTVLMPGDPLRAKYIAETYLKDVKLVNSVRNMFMYTGTYKGKPVTIAGSGMGCPSIGIYSYELFKFYDVENIIRIGSAGSYVKELKLFDLVLATGAYSDDLSFSELVLGEKNSVYSPDEELNKRIEDSAKKLNIDLHKGVVHSSGVFYSSRKLEDTIKVTKSVCVEMESYALFINAKKLNKKAACLLTISDSLVTHEATNPEQREKSFKKMMEVALGIL
ncbi:MAG: purine-nucleoside phosphorylase [Metamycoplasmataceae bacterium]